MHAEAQQPSNEHPLRFCKNKFCTWMCMKSCHGSERTTFKVWWIAYFHFSSAFTHTHWIDVLCCSSHSICYHFHSAALKCVHHLNGRQSRQPWKWGEKVTQSAEHFFEDFNPEVLTFHVKILARWNEMRSVEKMLKMWKSSHSSPALCTLLNFLHSKTLSLSSPSAIHNVNM